MPNVVEFFFSFEQNQLLGTAVNFAIAVIGTAALIEVIGALLRLRSDVGQLDRFAGQLQGRSDPAQIADIARSLPGGHLAARRVRVLHDLRGAGADIEPDALAAIAVAELDREARFTRWASSTVVLFGLAGTLLGLTQAVLRAQPLLREILSGPAAIEAVMGTFSGLGTAFSTTLMGIIWAVVLGIGLGHLRAKQSAFLQRLEELSLVHLFPYFRTSPALAMVEAAKKLTALDQQIGVALTEMVGQLKTQGLALTKVVEDSIGSLVEESHSTGQGLRVSVEASLGQVIHEMQERGVALTSTVDRSLATLIEELRTGTAAMLGRLDTTHQAAVSLLGDPTADSRTLAQNLAVLEQGVNALHNAAQRMTEMTPAIEEAIARQVDRQSRDLHETMHAYVGELNRSVERQDAIIEEGLIRVGEGFPHFGELILERLEQQGQILANSLQGPHQQIAAALQDQAQHTAALEQATEKLHGGAELLRQRGAQDQESVRKLMEAITEVGVQLRAIGSQLQQLERSAATLARPGHNSQLPTTQREPIAPPSTSQATPTDGIPTPVDAAHNDGNGDGARPIEPAAAPRKPNRKLLDGFWKRLGRRTK